MAFNSSSGMPHTAFIGEPDPHEKYTKKNKYEPLNSSIQKQLLTLDTN